MKMTCTFWLSTPTRAEKPKHAHFNANSLYTTLPMQANLQLYSSELTAVSKVETQKKRTFWLPAMTRAEKPEPSKYRNTMNASALTSCIKTHRTHVLVADDDEGGEALHAAGARALAGAVHVHDLDRKVACLRRPQLLLQPLRVAAPAQLLLQQEPARESSQIISVSAAFPRHTEQIL